MPPHETFWDRLAELEDELTEDSTSQDRKAAIKEELLDAVRAQMGPDYQLYWEQKRGRDRLVVVYRGKPVKALVPEKRAR